MKRSIHFLLAISMIFIGYPLLRLTARKARKKLADNHYVARL